MHRSLQKLYRRAATRQDGYLEAVLSAATELNVGGGWYVLSDADFARLREEWDSRPRASRGLGDTIAKIARAVGIKPCDGCGKRRDTLNAAFPYEDPPVKSTD